MHTRIKTWSNRKNKDESNKKHNTKKKGKNRFIDQQQEVGKTTKQERREKFRKQKEREPDNE